MVVNKADEAFAQTRSWPQRARGGRGLCLGGHSATLFKPKQAHFGRFYGIMFFGRIRLRYGEGRRNADLYYVLIKTAPGPEGAYGGRKNHDFEDKKTALTEIAIIYHTLEKSVMVPLSHLNANYDVTPHVYVTYKALT